MVDLQRMTDRLFAPAADSPAGLRRDLWLLCGLALLLLGTGIGLRDPWPADEPRFALIARDMVASGHWLFPQVGGDLYQDKPPVFFWAIAAAYQLLGSLRLAFLLPSLLAGIGTILLVYDFGRRIWSRQAGLAAALLLLTSVQLLIQARAAQIDMLLTLTTTAALYGIGRHLLAGPDWKAYAAGGFAAGIGIITKGTGFLPLLMLLPFALFRRMGFRHLWTGPGGIRWMLAPASAAIAVALWLVPMLAAVSLSGDPRLIAYRDEILLQQTAQRYAAAWGHHEPWYYFFVAVIPLFWLPGTLLLPWLVPRWRAEWAGRDGRSSLLLGWILLVVLFFSFSPGKRGVYVLPALPAFALAAGPSLAGLLVRRGVQRALFWLAAAVGAAAAAAALYLALAGPGRLATIEQELGVVPVAPLAVIAAMVGLLLAWLRPRRAAAAWVATIAVVAVVQGLWINPLINDARSGRDFVETLQRTVPAGTQLGLVGYREQYLLYLSRPVTNFGHRRRQDDAAQEARDAALWLDAAPGRVLLVDDRRLPDCFGDSPSTALGYANGRQWSLVSAPADPRCAALGETDAALEYRPPGT